MGSSGMGKIYLTENILRYCHYNSLLTTSVRSKLLIKHSTGSQLFMGTWRSVNNNCRGHKSQHVSWPQNHSDTKKKKESSQTAWRELSKSLIFYVKGTSGRRLFRQDEEAAMLRLVLQKHRWPCFVDNSHSKVGSQGFDGLLFKGGSYYLCAQILSLFTIH